MHQPVQWPGGLLPRVLQVREKGREGGEGEWACEGGLLLSAYLISGGVGVELAGHTWLVTHLLLPLPPPSPGGCRCHKGWYGTDCARRRKSANEALGPSECVRGGWGGRPGLGGGGTEGGGLHGRECGAGAQRVGVYMGESVEQG